MNSHDRDEKRKRLPAGYSVAHRFEIQDRDPIGGSFGLTYQALDLIKHRKVALKEYFPRRGAYRRPDGFGVQFTDEETRLHLDLFRKEAGALGACPVHPGIASFISAEIENGTGYLALEWVDGEEFTKKERASDAEIMSWLLQLVDACLHLKEAKLVHRDIKPANIMIRTDGAAVLVDLGAARIVSGGATFFPHTQIMSPSYAGPEQFVEGGYTGLWTDVFGLCAAFYDILGGGPPVLYKDNGFDLMFEGLAKPLRIRKIEGDPRVAHRASALLSAVDLGLVPYPEARPRGGLRFIEQLGIAPSEIAAHIPASFRKQTLLLEPEEAMKHDISSSLRPKRRENDPLKVRHQTVLIQSLDSARFQSSSFLGVTGSALDNSAEEKIALARTEVFVNLLFGREIVLPAGHIADSVAIVSILGEALGIYLDRFQQKIDAAFLASSLPLWRPFRLALEDRSNTEGYVGFVKRYKYTGAPLPLLHAADRAAKASLEQMKAKGVEGSRALFLAGDYEGLETLTRIKGYAAYAARVAQYFTHEVSLFAGNGAPIESLTGYNDVFWRHLDNDYIAGAGVEAAQAKLPLVDKIKSDLTQFKKLGLEGATGYRGNWYEYADMFEEVWPLARGYLDTKLFLTLSSQYGIDHPILISQAFEYGVFDHSLVLGPRFGRSMLEEPKMDAGLKNLSASLAGLLPWERLFELYLDPGFLFSLRSLNTVYATGNVRDYSYAIQNHALRLSMLLDDVIKIDVSTGHVALSAPDQKTAEMTMDSYDPALQALHAGEELSAIGGSIFPSYGMNAPFDSAGVSLLPLRQDLAGTANQGSPLMHYFIRPLRMRGQR